jgi:hypothetical protein
MSTIEYMISHPAATGCVVLAIGAAVALIIMAIKGSL